MKTDDPVVPDPESAAYLEWKSAAIELEAAERARVAAAQRFQDALAKLARVVAPGGGARGASVPSS